MDTQPTEDDLRAMRRYALSLTRDDQEADDVVQDSILRAMERSNTFEVGRRLRPWLLAIVHNVFLTEKRKEAAEARRNENFAQTQMAVIDPSQEHHARLNEINARFAALPEHYRAVLHLIAIEGLSYQEAAIALDLPIGTVMSRLSRARSTLRDKLAGEKTKTQLRVVGGSDD